MFRKIQRHWNSTLLHHTEKIRRWLFVNKITGQLTFRHPITIISSFTAVTMKQVRFTFWVLFLLLISTCTSKPINSFRPKRQIDFTLDADHEEGIGTDFSAATSLNLWRSQDGNSRLDGHARYSQTFGVDSKAGNRKFGGGIHFTHNYWWGALFVMHMHSYRWWKVFDWINAADSLKSSNW